MTTNSTPEKTIRSIVDDLILYEPCDAVGCHGLCHKSKSDDSVAQITHIIEECKPKHQIGAPVDEYETGGECSAYADGANAFSDEFERALKERIG